MSSSRKADRYERECVNALREAGFGAQRTPASGSATERELPDILAGRGDLPALDGRVKSSPAGWPVTNLLGIEHKCGSATTLYVKEEEVEKLESWADVWHAKILLGARFTSQSGGRVHYFVPPEDARRTNDDGTGNYGLPEADIKERAVIAVDANAGSVRLL